MPYETFVLFTLLRLIFDSYQIEIVKEPNQELDELVTQLMEFLSWDEEKQDLFEEEEHEFCIETWRQAHKYMVGRFPHEHKRAIKWLNILSGSNKFAYYMLEETLAWLVYYHDKEPFFTEEICRALLHTTCEGLYIRVEDGTIDQFEGALNDDRRVITAFQYGTRKYPSL